jgi:hypothetical protein
MTTIEHPDWCLRTFACTAAPAGNGLPARGEHRGAPQRIDTTWGGIVATLVESPAGRAYVEVRLSVAIPADESRARLRASLIADEIQQAVDTAVLDADLLLALANHHALTHGYHLPEVTP